MKFGYDQRRFGEITNLNFHLIFSLPEKLVKAITAKGINPFVLSGGNMYCGLSKYFKATKMVSCELLNKI